MVDEPLSNSQLFEVLEAWAFFLALLTAFFLPAFFFRRWAKRNGKKGWLFFLLGLGIGLCSIVIGNIVVLPLRYFFQSGEYFSPISILFFVSALAFQWFVYRAMTNNLK
jgi:hypothetical protein